MVALEDDDDLLQPVYQEPFQQNNMKRGAIALNNVDTLSSDENNDGSLNKQGGEPATLQLIRKGKDINIFLVLQSIPCFVLEGPGLPLSP